MPNALAGQTTAIFGEKSKSGEMIERNPPRRKLCPGKAHAPLQTAGGVGKLFRQDALGIDVPKLVPGEPGPLADEIGKPQQGKDAITDLVVARGTWNLLKRVDDVLQIEAC